MRRGLIITYSLLVNGYSNTGEVDRAEKVFRKVRERGLAVDVYLYTTLINGYCRTGKMKQAFMLFDECVEKGLKPNERTYGALINGLAKLRQCLPRRCWSKKYRGKGSS